MDSQRMSELIDQHITAEVAGDSAAAIAMYTDDVIHDVAGWPTGPVRGPAAAQAFYDDLSATMSDMELTVTRELYGEDFCVVEHDATARIVGAFMGIPGQGRSVGFRMIHVWEFKDDKMSRENVWLDGGAIMAQLSAGAAGPPAAVA